LVTLMSASSVGWPLFNLLRTVLSARRSWWTSRREGVELATDPGYRLLSICST
jgi:hypothetical protein